MKKVIFISFILISISIGTFVSAQGYIPIVGLPGVDSNALSTEGYVNALYKLAITVACLLALFKIIFGGVKWALSDVVTDKGDAKKDIKGALLGLLIVLSAVLVLNTINPNLTQLNIFGEGAPSIDAIERGQFNADTPFGSQFTPFGASEGDREHFIRNCKGITESSVVMRVGLVTKCYDRPSNIDAQIGDAFDASKYPPETGETRFEQTCKENGGVYNYNVVYDSTCDENISGVEIGSTLDLSGKSARELGPLFNVFRSSCPGTASLNGNNIATCS